MNDPHVEWLKYRVETAPHISYTNPAPVAGDTPQFKYRLEHDGRQDMLTLEMKTHYSSEGEATDAVRPFLEDWEASAALHGNLDQLMFRFIGSHVIDRAPTSGTHHVRASGGSRVGGSWTISVGFAAYPTPPARFRCNADVGVMMNRYLAYRRGKEPLLSVAYFCFSYVCLTGGTRAGAASKYNVEEELLKKLSTLAATAGDWTEARKAESDSTARPLTGKEKEWLDRALKLLIERVAAYNAAPTAPLPLITMANLPPI